MHNNQPIEQLDRFLVDNGIFGRLGAARQQTLGCVAFHFNWAQDHDAPQLVHASEVSRCTGQEYVSVRGVLSKLATYGALTTINEAATGQRRGTRLYYAPNLDTDIGAETLKLMSDSLAVCVPQTPQPKASVVHPAIIMPAIDFPSIASFVNQGNIEYAGHSGQSAS